MNYKKKAKKEGYRDFVGFVGDGINDAKALKNSDFGVSLNDSS